MSTEVCNETSYEVDEAEFAALAAFVLQKMHVSSSAELSIMFIDPEPMEELHVRWLGLEGPTDVMCPQVAEKQASAAGHSTTEEMLLLTVHGILHLLGYDHAEEEEKKVMFGLQRKLLLTFLAEKD